MTHRAGLILKTSRANPGALNLIDRDGDLIGVITLWPAQAYASKRDSVITEIADALDAEQTLGYPLRERSGPLDAYVLGNTPTRAEREAARVSLAAVGDEPHDYEYLPGAIAFGNVFDVGRHRASDVLLAIAMVGIVAMLALIAYCVSAGYR